MAIETAMKPYEIPIKMPKANLDYVVVTSKEYDGPGVIAAPNPQTYGASSAVNKLTKTYKVGINDTTPAPTITYTDVQAGVVVPTNSYDAIAGTGLPEEVETPTPAGHVHSALQVYEDGGRLWFTDEERYQLRELYLRSGVTLDVAARKMIVFTMPDLVEPGEQNIYVRFPWNGILKEVYAVNGNISVEGSTKIQVQVCPQSLMSSEQGWAPVGNIIEIFMTEISNSASPGIIVNKNDHFRLNILGVPSDVKGLTVELVILTNT